MQKLRKSFDEFQNTLFYMRKEARKMPEKRAKNGQFLPGTVNNPGGRPRENPEAKAILKAATPKAAQTLVELLDSKVEKIRLQAAQVILDRTQGKPEIMSRIEVSNADAAYDLARLSEEELETLKQISIKANAGRDIKN